MRTLESARNATAARAPKAIVNIPIGYLARVGQRPGGAGRASGGDDSPAQPRRETPASVRHADGKRGPAAAAGAWRPPAGHSRKKNGETYVTGNGMVGAKACVPVPRAPR